MNREEKMELLKRYFGMTTREAASKYKEFSEDSYKSMKEYFVLQAKGSFKED